jgi:hypothetical protein
MVRVVAAALAGSFERVGMRACLPMTSTIGRLVGGAQGRENRPHHMTSHAAFE